MLPLEAASVKQQGWPAAALVIEGTASVEVEGG